MTMITLVHSAIVQRILDTWMRGSQPRPTDDDLRDLIKALEDKLDELAPIVDAVKLLSTLPGTRTPDPAALTPRPQTPDPASK